MTWSTSTSSLGNFVQRRKARPRYPGRRRDSGVRREGRIRLMVLDTSALLAILLGEAEAEELSRAIAGDPKHLVSAFSALKAAVGATAPRLPVHRVELTNASGWRAGG